MEPMYLSIQQEATGNRIKKLLNQRGYTVRDIQSVMGFENPQAIYKWLSGKSLPTLDNLLILSKVLHTSMEEILVYDGDFVIYTTSIMTTKENSVIVRYRLKKNWGKVHCPERKKI